jgi:hypothetical protein
MLKLATKFVPQYLALENAYRAGFRYAELWLGPVVLTDWETVLHQARSYPNGYALHFPNRLDLTPELLEYTVTLYHQLCCRCLIIHQPMYDKFHEPLLRLDPELRLAIENHKLSLEELVDWGEQSPGLALDVEHLWKFTLRDASLEKLLDQVRILLTHFGEKLLHVHLPGYWPGFKEHRPMYCAREMIFPVLSSLAEARFEGLVVSEVDLEFQNYTELHMDILLFEAWRSQHSGCHKDS